MWAFPYSVRQSKTMGKLLESILAQANASNYILIIGGAIFAGMVGAKIFQRIYFRR